MKTKNRLAPNELTSLCNPDVFAFKNTSTIEPLDQVIGQEGNPVRA